MQTSKIERFQTRIGVLQAGWREGELESLKLLESPKEGHDATSELGQKLLKHLAGTSQDFSDVPLSHHNLTDFAAGVYQTARTIPAGSTATYLDLAKTLNNPGAVRAVGGALGKNPFLIVVPCHRILASGGKMGGFSAPGGCHTKEILLAAEGYGTESLFQDDQMEAAQAHLSECPRLGPIIEKAGPCPLKPLYPNSPFGALARAVLYQQLAGSAAKAIEDRVKKLGSAPFPTAQELAKLSYEGLRGAGVSGPKIRTLKTLAQAVLEGELQPETLHLLPNSQVEAEVSKIKGLGPWSARMFLLFHLGRRDVFPVKDLGIRKGFQELFGGKDLPKPGTMERRSKRWRPYRSLASWYLWRSLEFTKK